MDQQFQFDFFVIGGGSGGLSAAKWAARAGAKVGLADFVKPSPIGTKWGLGGTCVNVGCIPKKLMHYSSLLGEKHEDLREAGWELGTEGKPTHSWQTMAGKIQMYIKQLNFGYLKTLNVDGVKYFKKLAKLVDKHTIELKDAKGEVERVTAKYILIATGGRPTYPDIPGARELSITSDDIFWTSQSPGKTLVVGASYIALECAGFMHGLGVDVTVMVRSIFLRGFDQQMANKAADYMEKQGIKFVRNSVPTKITEKPGQPGWKIVEWTTKNQQGVEETHTGEYQTILFAIGRSADTPKLGLEDVGVKVAPNGKILANDADVTSVDNIFAIGDVCAGRLQLTPTAIMAGKLLAKRLFQGGKRLMEYHYVPTTVFTPLEYGCCGYSQEDAEAKFGKENIAAYGSVYKPLEWNMNENRTENAYAKIVIRKNDPQIPDRVIGLHFLGPEAGEVTQGFAVAIKKGISKEDLDHTVGIHPTVAECDYEILLPEEVVDGSLQIYARL